MARTRRNSSGWRPRQRRGFSFLEIIVALGIVLFVCATVGLTFAGSVQRLATTTDRIQAGALADEGIAAVRQIRDAAWNALRYETSGVEIAQGSWALRGPGTSDVIGAFTRTVAFRDVCRDGDGARVACPGAAVDVERKEVAAVVTWTLRSGAEAVLERTALLTNWGAATWAQERWDGGAGQAVWADATAYDADDGNIAVDDAGNVALAPIASFWTEHEDSREDPNELTAVETMSATDAWAIGDSGTILRFDGDGWEDTASPTTQNLQGLAMVTADDGWIVGDGGTILRWDGTAWRAFQSPTARRLQGVFVLAPNDGWIVGDDGEMLRWNGAAWRRFASPTTRRLEAVHCLAVAECWAVGDHGTALHWDGTSWTSVRTPTARELEDVYLVASNDAWVVGKNATMLHWDGVAWEAVDVPVDEHLEGVHLRSAVDGWAVGDHGTLLFWDGTEWFATESFTNEEFEAVHVASGGDGWAVGASGTIAELEHGFATQGTITSSAFGMGTPAATEVIAWDVDDAACTPTCAVVLEIATAPDAGGVPGVWTPWVGPYTTSAGALLPIEINGNAWVRWRATLSGNGEETPVLDAVRVSYE